MKPPIKPSRLIFTVAALVLPFACATSGDTDDDGSAATGPSSSSAGGAGTTSSGASTQSAGGSTTTATGTGSATTSTGTQGTGGMGGMGAGGMGAGGMGAGGMAPGCSPVGACEVCAASQCATQWNSCCSTTGCLPLARCAETNCNADVADIPCIQSMCGSQLAGAGGLSGPGALAALALGQCLDTTLMNPPAGDCTTCDQSLQ